jgi:hypothetical protein
MLAVPADTPFTNPVVFTVATLALLVLHVPPNVPSVRRLVVPVQKDVFPDIPVGKGFTVTSVAAEQPVDVIMYEIVVDPAATPVTSPVLDPTVAIPVMVLVHVPPAIPSLTVVVVYGHTSGTPVIAGGVGFTATVKVVTHIPPMV